MRLKHACGRRNQTQAFGWGVSPSADGDLGALPLKTLPKGTLSPLETHYFALFRHCRYQTSESDFCCAEVVDFIYFSLIDFPIFNVADIYITVSVFVLAIAVLFFYKEEDFEFLNFKTKKYRELK